MFPKTLNLQDLIGGVALIAIGGWFASESALLETGTSRRMGPGYFPMLLSVALIFLGTIIASRSLLLLIVTMWRGDGPASKARGPVFILAAPIFFGLTVKGLGFVPALFLACLLATQASRRMTPLPSLVLAAVVTAFSVSVFAYGLNLPFRLVGPWLSF